MSIFGLSRLKGFAALFAFFVFAGDIIADAVVDLRGDHCVTEGSQSGSDHEKVPCSHCACATHSGAVIVADFSSPLSDISDSASFLSLGAILIPPGLAASIDHPPQLV